MQIDESNLATARQFARRITAIDPGHITLDVIEDEFRAASELNEPRDPELARQLAVWLTNELFAAAQKHGGNHARAISEAIGFLTQLRNGAAD